MKLNKLATGSLLSLALLGAGEAPTFHITNTFKIGGDGRWDYVYSDAETQKLYVPRSSHVQVIDETTGKVVGDIPDTGGVHGVAIASDLHRGFASDGKDNAVTVFDTQTLKPLFKVKSDGGPDAIIYDPFSKLVFSENGHGGTTTLIPADAADEKVATTTIELGGKPEFAASDNAGHVFINLEDKNEVAVIDTATKKVTAHWPVAPGESPSGLAIDPKTHRLFIGCGDTQQMVVMNSDTGKVITQFTIGNGVDACSFDPGTNLAFASCGDGTTTAIHEDDADHFTPLPSIPTAQGARTMTVDIKTHALYLPTAEFEPKKEGERRPTMKPGTFQILELKQQ